MKRVLYRTKHVLLSILAIAFVIGAESDVKASIYETKSNAYDNHMDIIENSHIFGAGNSINNATNISLGSTYNGSITESNDIDYYSFTTASSGRITLRFFAGIEYINLYIYNESGEKIWDQTYIRWNNVSEQISYLNDIDLTKGTYYFVVEKEYGKTGNYNFNTVFTSANESFIETGWGSNNSFVQASHISLGITLNGQIANNDEKDFYKFETPESGRINLTLLAGIEYINLYLYNELGEKIWDQTYIHWNNVSEQISYSNYYDLTKGTYYFVVEKEYKKTGNYNFNTVFTSANESFIETGWGSNNSFANANSIVSDSTYIGQIGNNDEKDFYKFSLPSAKKININITANIESINLYLYNESGEKVWNQGYIWNDAKTIVYNNSIDLSGGTYYFVIERGHGTGNYSFKLSNPVIVKKQNQSITKITTSKTFKKSKLKKKSQSFNIGGKAKTKLSYKVIKGNKRISVNKNGKVTVKKGTKKGTYKIRVKITATQSSEYNAKSVTKTITIKVK